MPIASPAFAPPLIPESEDVDLELDEAVSLDEATNDACVWGFWVVGAAARRGMLVSRDVETASMDEGSSVSLAEFSSVVCWAATSGDVCEVFTTVVGFGVLDTTGAGVFEATDVACFSVEAALGVLDACWILTVVNPPMGPSKVLEAVTYTTDT